MKNNPILTFALFAFSQVGLAAQLPEAGNQMLQIPPVPIPQKKAPNLKVEQGTVPITPASDNAKVIVKSLHVTGQTQYSESNLIAITGFKPDSELTLSELRGMAMKITDYYHRNGYFGAQAYLPAQDVTNGALTIHVIEGHYGKIILHNQSNLSNNQVNSLLTGVNSGDLITAAPLESSLMLLSDVPGIAVNSTLVPSASMGASDLVVDVEPGKSVTGEVDADNAGNPYTGEYRLGATVNLNNLAGLGDVASLRGMTSGPGLRYARASYQMQFGKPTAGIAYSVLDYRLGREFEPLGAHGIWDTASVYGNYPLIRSRNNNLYAGLAFDDRTFQDMVDATSSVTNKKAYVLMPSLYGNYRDNVGGGGLNVYSLTLFTGQLDIQTPAARSMDAAGPQTNGYYNKLGYSATRLQSITDSISVSAAINGQFASKNLDVSEQMELGGMYGVRAYPEGQTYADEGYVLNLELRKQLPAFSDQQIGQIQLVGFYDTGTVTIYKNPWAPGVNSITLSGAGAGVTWIDTNNFEVRAYYAFKLGSEMPTYTPDNSGQFWLQAVKYF
ncbi:MAG: ShlB/FhaC/HecB family hemolysin secretion/activation protein [Pseudomonadales bacterium]|nr:ShlB/FhaC/HecB family hemolysin secretion/activation protein [Pseudomonadales bacterium]